MKKVNFIRKIFFLLIFIGFMGLNNLNINNISNPKSSQTLIPNNEYYIPIYYQSNIFNFNISSNVIIDLNLDYDSLEGLSLGSKQLKLMINNTNPINLNFTALFNKSSFISGFPEDIRSGNYRLDYEYNTVFKISSNDTISNISIQFLKIPIFGFDIKSQYSIGFYTNQSDLTILNTREIEGNGYNIIESAIEDLEEDKNYYITIYKITKRTTSDLSLVIVLSILIPISIISIISIISVISKKDYIRSIKKRTQLFSTGVHKLSIDEVLENENRSKIIDLILETPGIHFNELLRKTNLNPGNLVWHLEILNVYRIIKRKTIESFVVYLPYFDKNPLSNIDLKLQKSEFTLKILKIIEDDPGIWNTKISQTINISRKTIEYHIRKLEDLGLIYGFKEGNKYKLYPNFEADYFSENKKYRRD